MVLAGAAWAQPTTSKVTVPANPTGKKIEAPHYGDTLFEFFQDKYFSALTGLMTSQHFTRLAPHDDEAEVLRGGMLLSYGNHREAGELFERLIAQAVPLSRQLVELAIGTIEECPPLAHAWVMPFQSIQRPLRAADGGAGEHKMHREDK